MIPFVDLKSQQTRIRSKIEARFAEIMDDSRFILGQEVEELESQLAQFCGVKHTLTCSSGTDAIILALMLKGVGRGDAVIVPAFTFVATAEAVAVLGATPVFADVLSDTFNLDSVSAKEAITVARESGLTPQGVISVGLFGQPADMEAIQNLANRENLWVLDDAAQSFGASYKGISVGNLGDIATTSFFPAKPLGCYGDGGAVFTNFDEDFEILHSLRVHGQGQHKYENIRLGMTSRLDTLQAAVLLEKLTLFPDEIIARQRVAERYNEGLQAVCYTPVILDGCQSTWAIYTVKVDPAVRFNLPGHLRAKGIPTGIYYPIPLHQQKAYEPYPRATEYLPVCEALSQEVLSLPMHAYLNEETQDQVIQAFCEAIQLAI